MVEVAQKACHNKEVLSSLLCQVLVRGLVMEYGVGKCAVEAYESTLSIGLTTHYENLSTITSQSLEEVTLTISLSWKLSDFILRDISSVELNCVRN